MTLLQAFFLAVIQGLTEFLPVSSSGHLVLFQYWFGLPQEDLTFTIIVHLASALAIMVYFWPRVRRLVPQYWFGVIIGTIPLVIMTLIFRDQLNAIFSNVTGVSIALLMTAGMNAVMQFVVTRRKESSSEVSEKSKKLEKLLDESPSATNSATGLATITWKQALSVGLVQMVAILPGISRSGSTVLGGLLTGLSRQQAFEFSFLLALPAIMGATVLQLIDAMTVWNVSSSSGDISMTILSPYMVGFIVALTVSFISLRLLEFMMYRAHFWLFSVYCLIFGLVGLLW